MPNLKAHSPEILYVVALKEALQGAFKKNLTAALTGAPSGVWIGFSEGFSPEGLIQRPPYAFCFHVQVPGLGF